MLKFLLITLILIASFIGYRIYQFFKKHNAPILNGQLKCNVRYKRGKKLDIYLPTQKVFKKAPVLVFFHGGAWVFGTKKAVNNSRFNTAFNELREKGYAVVSPSYTLAKSGKSPFPNCISDANDALLWIEKNADKYNFDVQNVGVMGESAGAHIGMMASFDRSPTITKPHNLSIRYLINIYGPTHLHQLYQDLTPLLNGLSKRIENMPSLIQNRFNVTENLFGFNPKEDPLKTKQFTERYSPYNKVTEDAPNTLIIHGEHDQLVPVSQSYFLKDRLDALGIPNKINILNGVGHGFRGASRMQRLKVQQDILDFASAHYINERQPMNTLLRVN